MEGRAPSEPGGARHPRATVDPLEQIENEDDDEDDCSRARARLAMVGRGSVRTGGRASPARYG
jgi:hypothetical protein